MLNHLKGAGISNAHQKRNYPESLPWIRVNIFFFRTKRNSYKEEMVRAECNTPYFHTVYLPYVNWFFLGGIRDISSLNLDAVTELLLNRTPAF
jgi:hypothetical protein